MPDILVHIASYLGKVSGSPTLNYYPIERANQTLSGDLGRIDWDKLAKAGSRSGTI